MTPTNDFKPFEKEKKVIVTITKTEAVLIYKLRKYAYADVMVQKVNGIIVRIKPTISELVDSEQEIEL
jgi:hypothetical protein